MNYRMDTPMNEHDGRWLKAIVEILAKFALPLMILGFSLAAKIVAVRRYKKRMTKTECVVDVLFSGFGSAITIYVLYRMNLPLWLFCICGGFSGVLVTPVTTVIAKEATPTAQTVADAIKRFIKKWGDKEN